MVPVVGPAGPDRQRPRRMDWPANSLLGMLAEPTRAEFVALGSYREFASDEVLLREGDATSFVVLLLSGWVKVTATTENGGFALLAIRHGGDLVGEQAGLDGEPRSATVTAAGAVLAKVVSLEAFLAFLRAHPDANRPVLQSVSAKLRNSTRRRVEFSGCTVAMRLARVVCELERSYGAGAPDGTGRRVQIALTQPELAALVGAAEPTVHKVLRELRQQGIVDTRYRAIVIRDVDALYQAAGITRDP
ncbi:cAMP-binding domain of CRP or a regulatory subunit of cAMP-dependent protein kinases [Parafrankia irregularis]|uniref:cAMP-binding domain of CRP or a regulatory subunit of cAMP-dependent protein kinases n=1 Tax=Parafrankia irregularis TaxID=795642 RepID=A0A0S4QTH5_9ACTN|nr:MULTISPECIES: Crp/Fnr family transcriptional regulator [Parafrankia]MBE3202420.1 Crp/Fnr family transcriptional regulator [Parafrankia sp. CH37]CUU58935.1 cAMP-binding domain of CRP or a regulatory subunit of cAMP-dependent protein kinases [Parafrankia irregularis]